MLDLGADIVTMGVPFGFPSAAIMAFRFHHACFTQRCGVGSGRTSDVDDARVYGAKLYSAYDMHDMGMDALLDQIPYGGPYLPDYRRRWLRPNNNASG